MKRIQTIERIYSDFASFHLYFYWQITVLSEIRKINPKIQFQLFEGWEFQFEFFQTFVSLLFNTSIFFILMSNSVGRSCTSFPLKFKKAELITNRLSRLLRRQDMSSETSFSRHNISHQIQNPTC